ncbi:MAG: hypothetical protein K1X79_07980 [Oligoflexia bacterium]|nr:hypothetical protein [Oligoflexia bacterium]
MHHHDPLDNGRRDHSGERPSDNGAQLKPVNGQLSTANDPDLQRVQDVIGHRFSDLGWLEAALGVGDRKERWLTKHSMGLDLVGDSALWLAIDQLIASAPGIHTEFRGVAGSNATYRAYFMNTGLGDSVSKIRQSTPVTRGTPFSAADMFEGLCGAIFLDAGIDAVVKTLLTIAKNSGELRFYFQAEPDRLATLNRIANSSRPHSEFSNFTAQESGAIIGRHPNLVAIGLSAIRLAPLAKLCRQAPIPTHSFAVSHQIEFSGLAYQRDLATRLDIDLRLRKSGKTLDSHSNILVLRAMFGAYFLKFGWQAALELWRSAEPSEALEAKAQQANVAWLRPHDFVAELADTLMSLGTFKPTYEPHASQRSASEPWWYCRIRLGKQVLAQGQGATEAAARQHAAEQVLELLYTGQELKLPRHGDHRH